VILKLSNPSKLHSPQIQTELQKWATNLAKIRLFVNYKIYISDNKFVRTKLLLLDIANY
jgi:hypothetical protein